MCRIPYEKHPIDLVCLLPSLINVVNITDSKIGRIWHLLLPAIILQSVLIGGGFATGREIVQYGARFGWAGWISGVIIFAGFSVLAIISFEFSRKFKAYDYRSFLKHLIGKGWILFDIIYFVAAVLIISVMISAAGEIMKSTLGLDYWVGVLITSVVVSILNFSGWELISRFKTIGTILLLSSYIYFSIRVIDLPIIQEQMNVPGSHSNLNILLVGLLYVGYNLGVFPASFYAVKGLKNRSDSVISGFVSGILMTVPWFLSFMAIISFYPDNSVIEAPVPWLVMLAEQGIAIKMLFGIVVGWTLIETATGLIHAFLVRIDIHLVESKKKPSNAKLHGLISLGLIGFAIILSKVGIIALVSKGYTALAWAMICVFALPLLTVGLFKIIKN